VSAAATDVALASGDGGGPATASPSVLDRVRALLNPLIVPALALLSALIVGGLVMIFTNPDTLHSWSSFFHHPVDTLQASWNLVSDSYRALWDGSLGTPQNFGRTLNEAAPLALGGLSVALAFRAGLFNIGAAGQLVIGATCAGWVGFTWHLPAPLHLTLAVLAGFAGGAAWGSIAGILKARTGAHEVITTIMLNYIAYHLLDSALRTDAFQPPGRDDLLSKPVPPSGRLPIIHVGQLSFHGGLFLAIAAAVAVWWLLERSTIGFRMRAVGANPFAARYAGMSVGAMYIFAMVLAGGLAGLTGTTQILGQPSFNLTSGYFAFLGFDAIAVALLGRANPAGVLGAAFLFGVLRAGANNMQAATDTPADIIVVIQALIILFVAAPALVRSIYRIKAGRGTGQSFTTNWGQ
jgi:general nucleoside transport system permease protein